MNSGPAGVLFEKRVKDFFNLLHEISEVPYIREIRTMGWPRINSRVKANWLDKFLEMDDLLGVVRYDPDSQSPRFKFLPNEWGQR